MTAPEPGDDILRGALVEALRLKGCLRSPALAEAFGAVPRHLFIPHVAVEEAYRDRHLFDILSTSGGRSHHFLKRFPNVLAGDFTPNFSIGLSRKDVSLALAMAARLEMLVPLASVRQVYEAAHAQGFGQLDMAGVTRLYEQWTGVAVRGAAARDGKPGAG